MTSWLDSLRQAGENEREALWPLVVDALEAAEAFTATMGRRTSEIHGRDVVDGFTSHSSDAARRLDAALASLRAATGEK